MDSKMIITFASEFGPPTKCWRCPSTLGGSSTRLARWRYDLTFRGRPKLQLRLQRFAHPLLCIFWQLFSRNVADLLWKLVGDLAQILQLRGITLAKRAHEEMDPKPDPSDERELLLHA